MKGYQITKYNPAFRDSDGAYLPDDWICHSDVGSMFNGVLLTENAYLHVENSYITAVVLMLKNTGLDHVRIVSLENDYFKSRLKETKNEWYYQNRFELVDIREDSIVELSKIELIVRLILKGYLWCRLEIDQQFYAHFGYDYYMFIGGEEIRKDLYDEITNMGLFIESSISPWRSSNHTWLLSRAKAGDMYTIDETEVPFINTEQVKKYLSLSDEHPGDIHFKIDQSNKGILQDQFELNFKKFDYSIFCQGNL